MRVGPSTAPPGENGTIDADRPVRIVLRVGGREGQPAGEQRGQKHGGDRRGPGTGTRLGRHGCLLVLDCLRCCLAGRRDLDPPARRCVPCRQATRIGRGGQAGKHKARHQGIAQLNLQSDREEPVASGARRGELTRAGSPAQPRDARSPSHSTVASSMNNCRSIDTYQRPADSASYPSRKGRDGAARDFAAACGMISCESVPDIGQKKTMRRGCAADWRSSR